MRFFCAVVPNLAICLNLALMFVVYLDMRNPMMGFLVGAPFLVLIIASCVCSIATAILLYAKWRNNNTRH